jgi:uncharacterized protein
MSPAGQSSGPVALVTGSRRGIGAAVAERLARDGLRVVRSGRADDAELAAAGAYRAADLRDADAASGLVDWVIATHGRLDVLVNNAGASWRARFADGGYENVRRTMALNFDAQVRVTEALLPLLRASAPSAIVNVSSTAGRVARAGAGAYSASKFALAGWSDSLRAEEHSGGVHVGLVMPGFIATEGFPAAELLAKPWTRWVVSTPERAAEAIYDAALRRRPERWVPRPYALAAALRILAPALVRRALGAPAAAIAVTATGADAKHSARPAEVSRTAGGRERVQAR